MIAVNKKGATLIELVLSIAIIVMVVVSTASAIILSQESVFTDTKREEASMMAQNIADELIVEMSGKTFSENQNNVAVGAPLNVVDGAKYVNVLASVDFPLAHSNGSKQFAILDYNNTVNSVSMLGTKILVCVYYNDTEYVVIEGFAPTVEADN